MSTGQQIDRRLQPNCEHPINVCVLLSIIFGVMFFVEFVSNCSMTGAMQRRTLTTGAVIMMDPPPIAIMMITIFLTHIFTTP